MVADFRPGWLGFAPAGSIPLISTGLGPTIGLRRETEFRSPAPRTRRHSPNRVSLAWINAFSSSLQAGSARIAASRLGVIKVSLHVFVVFKWQQVAIAVFIKLPKQGSSKDNQDLSGGPRF